MYVCGKDDKIKKLLNHDIFLRNDVDLFNIVFCRLSARWSASLDMSGRVGVNAPGHATVAPPTSLKYARIRLNATANPFDTEHAIIR